MNDRVLSLGFLSIQVNPDLANVYFERPKPKQSEGEGEKRKEDEQLPIVMERQPSSSTNQCHEPLSTWLDHGFKYQSVPSEIDSFYRSDMKLISACKNLTDGRQG